MAGLAVFAFSAGGFTAIITAYAVFAFTMGALMVIVSLLASTAKGTGIKSLKKGTGRIKKITSLAQTAVGVLLILSVIYVEAFVGILFPG